MEKEGKFRIEFLFFIFFSWVYRIDNSFVVMLYLVFVFGFGNFLSIGGNVEFLLYCMFF